MQGQPIILDDEFRAFIFRCYEIHPKGHPNEGRRIYRRSFLSRSKGRALALDTPVPTPSGWTTMGDVSVGDFVFDDRGEPVRVLDTSPVYVGHDCYAVRFSDGEEIVADGDHLWTVQELRRRYLEVTVDTRTLFENRTMRSDGACNFRLQMPGELNLPDAELPIDPYILGYWLGDGRTNDSSVAVHSDDLLALLAQVDLSGYYHGEPKVYPGGTSYYVRISTSPIVVGGDTRARDTLNGRLRSLGVLENKHVPIAYLRASAKQRLALLQGLMDTDGTIGVDGRCGFVSTLECLARAVAEILASLGVKCAVREYRAKLNGSDCGPAWQVDFWATSELPVFRLERKLNRQKPRAGHSRLADTRRIVSVQPVESVPVRCITVDSPSHLFLAGRRMVQTHNSKSELAGMLACAEGLAEVRFDGWDSNGNPVGRPVTAPVVRCFATEEGQAGNTYENVVFMLNEGLVADEYPGLDVGLTRTNLPDGGRIVALSSAAASKDGGRDTFSVFDEVHLWTTPELKRLHSTVTRNLMKRKLADGWALETSTMYAPGENSVAEDTHKSAKSVPGVLFDHKEAPRDIDLNDDEAVLEALRCVYGPAASWMDLEAIVANELRDPQKRESDFRRYWLNQPWSLEERFVKADEWDACAAPERFETPPDERGISPIPDGADVVLAFDGSLNNDSTVLSVVLVDEIPHVDVIATWDRPPENADPEWTVDILDVEATIRWASEKWNVLEVAADPARWKRSLELLAAEGIPAVVFPQTAARMSPATKGLHDRITTKGLTHSGDARLRQHMLNAVAKGNGRAGGESTSYRVYKMAKDSPYKIDLAVTTIMGVDRAVTLGSTPRFAHVFFASDVAVKPQQRTPASEDESKGPRIVFHDEEATRARRFKSIYDQWQTTEDSDA